MSLVDIVGGYRWVGGAACPGQFPLDRSSHSRAAAVCVTSLRSPWCEISDNGMLSNLCVKLKKSVNETFEHLN